MIKINKLYDKFNGMVNEHYNGSVPINTWMDWVIDTQRIIFEELISDFQKTQVISDYITPFLDSVNVIVTKNQGQSYDIIKKPQGYEHLASCRILKISGKSCINTNLDTYNQGKKITQNECFNLLELSEEDKVKLKNENDKNKTEVKVDIVDNNRWAAAINHPRGKISSSNPAITQYSGGFKLTPRESAIAVIMDFFRTPKIPVFNYTIINPGTEAEYLQFNQNGSVDLEWSESLTQKFLDILQLKYNIFVGK